MAAFKILSARKKKANPLVRKFRKAAHGFAMKHVLFMYFIKELGLYFLLAFVFFFMVFFVNQILLMAESILRKRVPLWDVVRLITYSLPFIIAQSAPFATLLGFLMSVGRMATDNEILVMRALGISYWRFLAPTVVLGLVISLASFGVNDYLLPRGSYAYNKLYTEILLSNPGVEIEPYSVKKTQSSVLVIGDVTGHTVSSLLYFDEDDGGSVRVITAGETEILQAKHNAVLMQLSMDSAQMLMFKPSSPYDFDYVNSNHTLMNVFAADFLPDMGKELAPRDMTSYDLWHKIMELKMDPTTDPLQQNIYELEFHKKFSLPFGSIFFAIFALPLSIVFGKHNGQTIGLILGLFVSFIYWAMLIIGQTFGFRSGLNGAVTMWTPNIMVFAVGIFLFARLLNR